MSTAIKTTLIIGAVTLSVWLAAILLRQKNLLQNSCIGIDNVRLAPQNKGGISIDAMLTIKNYTDIPLHIMNNNLKFYINNQYAGFIDEKVHVDIPANGQIKMPLSLTINPIAIIKNISDLANSNLRIVGKLSIYSGILYFNLINIDHLILIKNILGTNDSSKKC